MKALRLYGHEDIRLEDVEEPEVKPGWALLEVLRSSICKSDIKEFHGPLYITGKVNPITGVGLPVTLGHEFCGRILSMNGSHSSLRVGDRVAVDALVTDGTCWFCRHGSPVLCDELAILGFDAHGSFAERIAVPISQMFKLPDAVSDEDGGLIEPLAVVTHAVRRTGVQPGDSVTVVGGGMIGIGALKVNRAAGASEVYVVEPLAERRARALEMGANAAIDPADGPAHEQILELTGGFGTDVAFDCVGFEPTLDTALRASRKGGRVGIIGVFVKPPVVDMNLAVLQERTVVGSLCYAEGDFARVIAMVADGRISTEGLITGRAPLRDVIEEGFMRVINEPEKHIRIVVDTMAV
jgi:(R,R)-butanediol dehydrogenase/meso-butanediol dehydrogenase/diacetyl reductase